jgi:hypothetical protein
MGEVANGVVTRVHLPTSPPRDVHSVVNDCAPGTTCKAPKQTQMEQPCVLQHRAKTNIYHAGGLFPTGVSHPWFRVRCVHTFSRWCARRLTRKELAAVYDMPHHVVEQISDVYLGRVLLHPGRTLERCIHGLMAAGGMINRGGILSFRRNCDGICDRS